MFKPGKSRYRLDQGKYCIDMLMNNPHQIFDERDPAPFRERDLDEDAVDYLMGSILEIPDSARAKIVITLPKNYESSGHESVIRDAIRSFFEYEIEKTRKEINLVLRQGEFAMFVGVMFLTACLGLAHSLFHNATSVLGLTLHEGLIIMGWVAMWRPIDVFLYAWWPMATRRRYCKKLLRTEIEFRFTAAATPAANSAAS